MLMRPNKAETAVHGCHCPDDMAVRMRKVLIIPWGGVRVCYLLLLLFYKTLPSITNRKNGVLKIKLERQTANVTARTRSRDFPEVLGLRYCPKSALLQVSKIFLVAHVIRETKKVKVKSDHRSKFSNLSNWKEEA